MKEYNKSEIIFVVEMNPNDGITSDMVSEFSKFYTDTIDKNEPNTLGWGFYKSGDKIILIERYLNDAAAIQHAKNISEGDIHHSQGLIYISLQDKRALEFQEGQRKRCTKACAAYKEVN